MKNIRILVLAVVALTLLAITSQAMAGPAAIPSARQTPGVRETERAERHLTQQARHDPQGGGHGPQDGEDGPQAEEHGPQTGEHGQKPNSGAWSLPLMPPA